MNEEEAVKVIIAVTPDAEKPKQAVRRNSTGQANTRISPSLLSSDFKILPRYLAPPARSCHDLCKGGRKHDFEAKKRHPMFRGVSGNKDILDEEQNQEEVSTRHERRSNLKVKATLPEDKLRYEPEAIMQKGQEEFQLSSAAITLEEESSKTSTRTKLMTSSPFQESVPSIAYTPYPEGEESSKNQKVKSTLPKDKLCYEPEAIMQKGQEEFQLSGAAITVEEESSKASTGTKLMNSSPFQESVPSVDHTPFPDGEESSKKALRIMTVPPSANQVDELYEEPENIKLETPTPTEKDIASTELTPLTLSEESSDGSASMELDIPSPIHSAVNQVEGSLDESVGMEQMSSLAVMERSTPAGESPEMKQEIPLSIEQNSKLETSAPTRKSIPSATLSPASREGRPSEKALITKQKSPSPIPRSVAATEKQNRIKSLKMGEEKKREVTKLKAAQQAKTGISDRAKDIKGKKIEVTAERNVIKKQTSSPAEKTVASVKQAIIEQKSQSSVKKVITSRTLMLTKQKASSPLERVEIPAKPLTSLKSRTAVVNSTSALTPSGRLAVRRNQGNKMIRSTDLSAFSEDKVLEPPRASLSPKPPVNRVVANMKLWKYGSSKAPLPVKDQGKAGKLEQPIEKVKEKTLYVIEHKPVKMEAKATNRKLKKNNSYSSSRSSSSTSSQASSSSGSSHAKEDLEDHESTQSEASELVLDNDGTRKNKAVSPSKGEDKRRPRINAAVRSKDKNASPQKLKFRRGTIVSPEKSDTSGLRKIRFRQARGPSENQNVKAVGRKIVRKRRGSCGSAGELSPPHSEAPAFVLRHQDVQEKKDSQGLLNHVIEKTASKLVESRKSKVKALVGAFETVISLQH